MKSKGMIKISDIKPHPKNPKIHTQKQIEKIAKAIEKHDFRKNIVISNDNYILAGHGGVRAAQEVLGMKEVPYEIYDKPHDHPDAIAYMLTDNRLNQDSAWDTEVLSDLITDLKVQEYEVETTGFDADEIENLTKEIEEDLDQELGDTIDIKEDKDAMNQEANDLIGDQDDVDDMSGFSLFGNNAGASSPQGDMFNDPTGQSINDLMNLSIPATGEEMGLIKKAIDLYKEDYTQEELEATPNLKRSGYILSRICKKYMEEL